MITKPLAQVEEVQSLSAGAKMLVVDNGEVKKAPVAGGSSGITSINGQTGPIVTLEAEDVGALPAEYDDSYKSWEMAGSIFTFKPISAQGAIIDVPEGSIQASALQLYGHTDLDDNGYATAWFTLESQDGVDTVRLSNSDDYLLRLTGVDWPENDEDVVSKNYVDMRVRPMSKTVTIHPSDWYYVGMSCSSEGGSVDDLSPKEATLIDTFGLSSHEFVYTESGWKLDDDEIVNLDIYFIGNVVDPMPGDSITIEIQDGVYHVDFPAEASDPMTYNAIPIEKYALSNLLNGATSGFTQYYTKNCGIFYSGTSDVPDHQYVAIGCPINSDGSYTPPTEDVDVAVTAWITRSLNVSSNDKKNKKKKSQSDE